MLGEAAGAVAREVSETQYYYRPAGGRVMSRGGVSVIAVLPCAVCRQVIE